MARGPTVDESFGSTSTTLLARARANDPLAWQRLVDIYSPLVYHWCRSARLQAADSADLLQDVFHAVARSLDRFRRESGRGSFRAWLRRITVNKLRDHLRSRATEPPAEGGSANHARIHELSAEPGTLDPDTPPSVDEDWLLLRSALEAFRADFEEPTWQAFWATTIDGRRAVDLADELGLSVNAIYKAKARILSRLRTELHLLVDLKRLGTKEP